MLEQCPHCHQRTISRWRDAQRFSYKPLICPNCHTPLKVSNLLRTVLTMLPITFALFVMIRLEPPPQKWTVAGALAVTGIVGWILGYKLPRYKEVKVKAV